MIVLDSSFLVGFHNKRDAHHNAACALMERFSEGEWGRGLLLDADELDFVSCSDFFRDAFEMYTHQSFADAAIAHVAQQRMGGLVLTFDDEFGKLRGIRSPPTVGLVLEPGLDPLMRREASWLKPLSERPHWLRPPFPHQDKRLPRKLDRFSGRHHPVDRLLRIVRVNHNLPVL